MHRWWVYQAERFPVGAHGLLIAVFSLSAITFSTLLRGDVSLPNPLVALVGAASAFLFFLQLRIADEFKDAGEDARYRPYRPVPRGLVSLRELAVLGGSAALAQLALALWLRPSMVPLLALVWIYLALMSREFFVRDWLKARPITYMWSHMLIMPLIDFYVTGCDWRIAGAAPPSGLGWLLAASFLNGTVIEIGRKIRAPRDEETGVQTYSVLWGRRPAVLAWLAAILAAAAAATLAASRIGAALPVLVLLGGLFLLAALIGRRFLRSPATAAALRIERMSGLWTILLYLSLGPVPLLWRWIG